MATTNIPPQEIVSEYPEDNPVGNPPKKVQSTAFEIIENGKKFLELHPEYIGKPFPYT